MLAVECLFEFPSNDIKNGVLSNYEEGVMQQKTAQLGFEGQDQDVDPMIDLNNFGQFSQKSDVQEEED